MKRALATLTLAALPIIAPLLVNSTPANADTTTTLCSTIDTTCTTDTPADEIQQDGDLIAPGLMAITLGLGISIPTITIGTRWIFKIFRG